MADWVMVPRDKLEKLAKLTAFNTSALAANIGSWAKNLLAAAPQQRSNDIHSCSYYCTRPECVRAQRDELRDRLEAQQQAEPQRSGITAEQVEQIKRLADEAERSAVDVAVAECAVMMVDPGIKYKRQQLDEDRAALHAALDALVAKETT